MMDEWRSKIELPEPGWLVTVSKTWWKEWESVMDVHIEGRHPLGIHYRFAWSNFCYNDWEAEPFLVVKTKADMSYVIWTGHVPGIEVEFLVGEKLKHIFAEAKNPELLNNIFLRV